MSKIFFILFLWASFCSLAQNDTLLTLKARYYLNDNQLDSALIVLNKIEKHQYQSTFLLGTVFQLQKNDAGAKLWFEKSNEFKDAYASYRLMQLYALNQKWDSAAYYLNQHLNSFFKVSSVDLATDVALDEFRQTTEWKLVLEKTPYSIVEKNIEQAQYFFTKSKIPQALDILDEVLQNDKKNHKALFLRAQYVVELNRDYSYAIRDLEKSIQIAPLNSEYLMALSKLFISTFKFKKALLQIENYQKIDPFQIESELIKAECFYRLGQFDNALKSVDKVVWVNPKQVEAYRLGGLVCFDSNQFEKALVYQQNAIALFPRRVDLIFDRGKTYLELEQNLLAELDFGTCVDLNHSNGEFWYFKALASFYQNKKEQACRFFKKASSFGYYKADEYLVKECN